MQHVGNALLLRRNRGAERRIVEDTEDEARCAACSRRRGWGRAASDRFAFPVAFGSSISLHCLWAFQPSDFRHSALPVIGAGVIS